MPLLLAHPFGQGYGWGVDLTVMFSMIPAVPGCAERCGGSRVSTDGSADTSVFASFNFTRKVVWNIKQEQ